MNRRDILKSLFALSLMAAGVKLPRPLGPRIGHVPWPVIEPIRVRPHHPNCRCRIDFTEFSRDRQRAAVTATEFRAMLLKKS